MPLFLEKQCHKNVARQEGVWLVGLLSVEMIKLPGYKVMLLLSKSSQFFSNIKQWEHVPGILNHLSSLWVDRKTQRSVLGFFFKKWFSVRHTLSGKPKENLEAHLYSYLCWSPSITRVIWTLCSCWFHSKAYQGTPEFIYSIPSICIIRMFMLGL